MRPARRHERCGIHDTACAYFNCQLLRLLDQPCGVGRSLPRNRIRVMWGSKELAVLTIAMIVAFSHAHAQSPIQNPAQAPNPSTAHGQLANAGAHASTKNDAKRLLEGFVSDQKQIW